MGCPSTTNLKVAVERGSTDPWSDVETDWTSSRVVWVGLAFAEEVAEGVAVGEVGGGGGAIVGLGRGGSHWRRWGWVVANPGGCENPSGCDTCVGGVQAIVETPDSGVVKPCEKSGLPYGSSTSSGLVGAGTVSLSLEACTPSSVQFRRTAPAALALRWVDPPTPPPVRYSYHLSFKYFLMRDVLSAPIENVVYQVFSKEEAYRICAMPVSTRLLDDKRIWGYDKKGLYSNSTLLWRAYVNNLPTKDNLSHRGIDAWSVCEICGLSCESSDHLLLQCIDVANIWRYGPLRFES
ncbi:hypothetical protein SASPL_126433 [Salvia splendens]|uniref:Reverse transcriptase zinc-binding domain-containing protein n=1 Tax=Salvia splendens TaxID=180675 RepID=A0A8X8XIW8_SALSN|nr:hypothetical protein SASPL_126433 [Salvia splendens]